MLHFFAQTAAHADGYYVPGLILVAAGGAIGTVVAAMAGAIAFMYKRQSDAALARENTAATQLATERAERTAETRQSWMTIQTLTVELGRQQEAQRVSADNLEELADRISELTNAEHGPPSRLGRPRHARKGDSR